jgi:hypothetical protein
MSTNGQKYTVAKAFRHLDPNQGIADGISGGFSSIRYRGKQWALLHAGNVYPFQREDDGSPLSYIDCVVLGSSPGLSKVYFGSDPWKEDSTDGPICTSLRGDVPDPGVPIPQSASCGTCSHNDWITKPTGGRGKECQDHKRLAILLMPAMTRSILPAPLLEPVHLKIPPASLIPLKSYNDELVQQGLPFCSVVTRISWSPDKIFQMTFNIMGVLSDSDAPLILPLLDSPTTKRIVGGSQVSLPPPRPQPSKVETGLRQAFAPQPPPQPQPQPTTFGLVPDAQPKRARGRPRRAAETEVGPELQQTVRLQADAAESGTQAIADPPAAPPAESSQWQESSSDLDDAITRVMGDRMQRTLK